MGSGLVLGHAGIGAVAGAKAAVALTLLHRPAPGYCGITHDRPEVAGAWLLIRMDIPHDVALESRS